MTTCAKQCTNIEQQYREGPMYSYLLILGANTDSKVIYAKYYKHWKGAAQNSHLHTELEAYLAKVEFFYNVKYGLSIITSKVSQKISVIKNVN